jgi:hypothetical protein
MAFLADRYKTPFTWGAEEMAKTAVYPEKSVLKSQVFNSVVVAVIAVSGTWGIGQRVAGMLNPINALNVPEAAEQASLFVGAYLLGLYFSLSLSEQKLTPQEQKIKLLALAGHIGVGEGGLALANMFSAGSDAFGILQKQIADSVLDVVVTERAVAAVHNVFEYINPWLEKIQVPAPVRAQIKHQTAATFSLLAAVGTHDVLDFMQKVLLPVYAGAYGAFGVYKGAEYVAKNVEKPKFWQRVGVAASTLMMAFNMTGSVSVQQQAPQASLPKTPVTSVVQKPTIKAPVPIKIAPKIATIQEGSSFTETLAAHLKPAMIERVSDAFNTPNLVQAGEKIIVEQHDKAVSVAFRGEKKVFSTAEASQNIATVRQENAVIKQGGSFSEMVAGNLAIKPDSKQMQRIITAFGTPDLVQAGESIALKERKEGVEITFNKQKKLFDPQGNEILPKAAYSSFWAVGKGGTLIEAMQTTLAKAGLRNDAAFAYRALKEFQKYHGIDIDSVQPADATALVRNKDSITLYLKKDGQVYSRTITEKPKQAEGVSPVMTLMQQAREAIGRG